MVNINKKQQGFTIVELLIVIVVIGILAGLVVTTFTGIQQRARNTERQTDIKAIHGQVEAFYAQYGKYPARDDINSATWRSTNMKGLDAEALKDPSGTAGTLVATPAANSYAYAVFMADGTTACTNATDGSADCAVYTLTATNEGGTTYVKTNLN